MKLYAGILPNLEDYFYVPGEQYDDLEFRHELEDRGAIFGEVEGANVVRFAWTDDVNAWNEDVDCGSLMIVRSTCHNPDHGHEPGTVYAVIIRGTMEANNLSHKAASAFFDDMLKLYPSLRERPVIK